MSAHRAWVVAVALLLARAEAAAAAVEVQARLDRSQIAVGESAVLEVVVRGAGGGIADPSFVAPGLEVLAHGREQSFSWINGRTSSETVFRYGVSASRPGTFLLGPIRVKVGGQAYLSDPLRLAVVGGATLRRDTPGGGLARLLVDVAPAEPWVGQPVTLRVRLVLGADLAEDPNYLPPATGGFWAESPGPPESYEAREGGRRVLVTETRTVLYPLSAGRASIGPASAELVFAGTGGDPFALFGGARPGRVFTVRSAPVAVRVRPLAPGAPVGFDGAVGAFVVGWSADRARTALDVPVTMRLDVRGEGNLPLARAPRLEVPGCEVFASTVDDSLAAPGRPGAGRRRFQWNVLPRRQGRLEIAAPAFAWFDPREAAYRSAAPLPVAIEVGPALMAAGRGREGFPEVFSEHPVDPFAGGARPWGWALAGLMLGAAAVLLRAAARPDPGAAERARAAEWQQALHD
ncbi:MAG: BatD family protein, partial [Candidatus Eisenbacteria bacterium]|nr:BatD family protein [Candidatus Eisenbacteria bacterium]